MKKTFVMILGFLLLSVMAFAEYQAFNYQGSIKMPVMVMKKVDGKWIKTWQFKKKADENEPEAKEQLPDTNVPSEPENPDEKPAENGEENNSDPEQNPTEPESDDKPEEEQP